MVGLSARQILLDSNLFYTNSIYIDASSQKMHDFNLILKGDMNNILTPDREKYYRDPSNIILSHAK